MNSGKIGERKRREAEEEKEKERFTQEEEVDEDRRWKMKRSLLLVVVVFKELLQFINVAHMHQILLDGCISNQTICTGS